MKITRTLAEDVASKMVQKLRDEKKKHEDNLAWILCDWMIQKIPQPVMDLFKSSHKRFLNTSFSVRLSGHGYNWNYYRANEFPVIDNDSSLISLTEEMANTINPINNKILDLEKEIKERFETIENALITLGTMKRVSEQFPEALPFFPAVKPKEAVMVNLTEVREFAKGLASK